MAAGMLDQVLALEVGQVASMRPRPNGRGNATYAALPSRRASRFNEAAAEWPRE